MLRFLSERRAWVVAALGVLALAGVVAWGLRSAPARASAMLEARLGMQATVEDADVRLGGLALHGLELRGEHGGVVIRIERVDAKANLLAALLRGSAAVRSVSASGAEVRVDLDAAGADESLRAIRQKLLGRSAPASSGGRAEGGRTYEVSDVSVHVTDLDGPLVTLSGVQLGKQGNELRYAAAEALLGDRGKDYALVGPTELGLRRAEGALQLHALHVDGAEVRSLRNGDSETRPLALRVRRAARLARGEPPAPPEPAAPVDPPATPEVTAPNADAGATAAPLPSPITPPPARLFARLTPDVEISVSNVKIESRTTEDGRVERIEDFDISVDGGSNGWYRVAFSGETSRKGTLQADLSLMPEEARAEGSIKLRRISLALIAPFVPELPLYDPEASTMSAQLELAADSPERVAIRGGFQVDELAVFSERIAADPIEHVNVAVRGKGAWLPDLRRLEIESAQVRMNEARVLIEGELERTSEHYRIDVVAKLPPTDCNDVVGAIPKDVLGSLTRFEWSGNWSAFVHISLDSRDLEATDLSIKVRNLCLFEDTPRWVRVERFQEPFRHKAVEPDETVFQMVTGPGTDNWVAFSDISPFMVPAVISHEDGGFYDHGGFAPWAIRDALVRNLEEGRYVVGASTISMQLAKNLYLQREKTLARKAQEVLLTWWLENALTKDEILELYLNVIEYGPGVYGLRNAAAYYFGRFPSELSPGEAAFLACMLPSPKRYHVSYERGTLTRSMRNRSRRLLEHMAKRERIGPEALAYGSAELEDFHFYRPEDPPPPPRALPPLGAPEPVDPLEVDPYEALFLAP